MRILEAVHAALAFAHAGQGKVAPAEEIVRRGAICSNCPALRKVDGLPTEVSKFLGELVNTDRVPEELSDRACGVCGCSLMLLVPALLEDIHEDLRGDREQIPRPDQCWISKGTENTKGK